jgi:hypothetical protein
VSSTYTASYTGATLPSPQYWWSMRFHSPTSGWSSWSTPFPEVIDSAKDPSGGYPLVLKEVYEWMKTHQDLLPGLPDEDVPPPLRRTTVGSNLRISANNVTSSGTQAQFYSSDSGATWGQMGLPIEHPQPGAQTSPRSESDIRINFWNPSKVIGARPAGRSCRSSPRGAADRCPGCP